MYYKVYYPLEFWYVKMKYTKEDGKIARFKERSDKNGALLFCHTLTIRPILQLEKWTEKELFKEVKFS